MRNIKKYFESFLQESQFLRGIRGFFKLKFLPYLRKFLVITLVFVGLLFITLKSFKPDLIIKTNNKISQFLFHNLNLDNQDFKNIKISGNKRETNEEVIASIMKAKNIFAQNQQNNQTNVAKNNKTLIQVLALELKKDLPWINQINITRTLPNSLNIAIVEYEPFAIWQNNDQKYVIDKEGNKIKIDSETSEFNHLVILSGNGANLNVKSLFNIFVINPEFSERIYSATWVGNRRWDIRFDNGLLVKLSANNLQESWRNLIKIYNTNGSLNNLQIIDLRIEKKIYLKYSDSQIKEIRDFKL